MIGDSVNKEKMAKYGFLAFGMVLGLTLFWFGGSASFDWAEAGSGSGTKPWSFWAMVLGAVMVAAGFIYALYLVSEAVVRRDRSRADVSIGSAT